MTTTTLAIDTSCDETSCAVVRNTTVLSNVLPSQIEFHKKYGGVVPSVARLAHEERIDGVVLEALKRAKITMQDIDQVAVTIGPGLAIALEVGIKKAKALATEYKKPLIPVNHMEGHLLSVFAKGNGPKSVPIDLESVLFPALGVLVSGKHTELVLVHDFGEYEVIGETLDDACGEAFDKCGRMLGLGYPAGPVVAEFAKQQRKEYKVTDERRHQSYIVKTESGLELPVAMANSPELNFSYSGLKTAFKQLIEKISGHDLTVEAQLEGDIKGLTKEKIYELSVLFEEAAFRPIEIKVKKALEKYDIKEIWLGGGVSANTNLRSKLRKIAKAHGITFRVPYTMKLNTDNAAMIGTVVNINLLRETGKLEILTSGFEEVDRVPGLGF